MEELKQAAIKLVTVFKQWAELALIERQM